MEHNVALRISSDTRRPASVHKAFSILILQRSWRPINILGNLTLPTGDWQGNGGTIEC